MSLSLTPSLAWNAEIDPKIQFSANNFFQRYARFNAPLRRNFGKVIWQFVWKWIGSPRLSPHVVLIQSGKTLSNCSLLETCDRDIDVAFLCPL